MLDPAEPGLRQVLLLMGPGTLGLAATQVNVFVNTWLATGEGTGAVSWLGYAFRLMYLPLGIFGVSIATASLPAISRRAAAGDLAGMRDTVSSSLAMMLTLNVPATIGLIVLAHPIVALLFERGQFTAADTAATAGALVAYAVGLTGYSVVKIASPTFYALGESRTPVLVSVLSVLTNAALNILFVREFGYRGLALGTSLTALLNAGLLMLLLRRRLDGLHVRHLASVLVRVAIAGAVMGVAAWGLDRQLHVWMPGTALPIQIARVGVAITGALLALGVSLKMLRVTEFTDVVGAVVGALSAPAARSRQSAVRLVVRSCPAMARYSLIRLQHRHRPRRHEPGHQGLLIANTAMFVASPGRPGHQPVAWPDARSRGDAGQDLAAGHLHVHACGCVSHPVQHAGPVDVRRRARADVGHAVLRALLRRHGHRRRAHHHRRVAAAVAVVADRIYRQ